MNFIVPEEIGRKLAEIEVAQLELQNRKERAREAENARLSVIARLRKDRIKELLGHADDLTIWHNHLHLSGLADRLHGIFGESVRVPVFIAKFWRGEPSPSTDVTTWAVLSLRYRKGNSPGSLSFYYEEWHKGWMVFEDFIRYPIDIVEKVHPDFLAQLHAHLNGPDSWRYILQDLQRRK